MPEEDDNFVMGNKCLEFCQALASQGQKFSFSLNIGSNFSFSLDTKEKYTSLDTKKVDTLNEGRKKKLSPSQVRRNLKRKEDFLKRKSEQFQSEQAKKTFLCDHCENVFIAENDLNIHMEKMHKEKDSFENIEQLDGYYSLPMNNFTLGDESEGPRDPVHETIEENAHINVKLKGFKCEYCEYKNLSEDILNKHMKKKHKNQNDEKKASSPLTCTYCGEVCENKINHHVHEVYCPKRLSLKESEA